MVCPSTTSKKRYRSSSSSQSIMTLNYQADNIEEYERAVTFLQEFHSRRVAAFHSTTSSTLDAITEEFDDLADDFSLALNVGSRHCGLLGNLCGVAETRRTSQMPKMRKTANFNCLTELDNTSADYTSSLKKNVFNGQAYIQKSPSSNLKEYDADAYDNITYCFSSIPVAKRHRGRLDNPAYRC